MLRRPLTATALGAASVLLLAGCAASGADAADGRIDVLASTNVYGQIAEVVGGDHVDVTSIIHSAAQDPHSYEASARDQLAVSRADLIVENGGGYDAFVDALIQATGTDAPVITAAELSPHWSGDAHDTHATHGDAAQEETAHDDAADGHGHDHVEGFNEHVWYDLHTTSAVADEIAHQLSEIDPGGADGYSTRASDFTASVESLEASLAQLAATHGGTDIFVTEPVPLYLTEEAGLVNTTPDAFSEAVEEGQDVPPATLLEALGLLRAGHAKAVIVNSQTGGVETDAVIAEAKDAGIPVLEFSEVLPDGLTYVEWMQQNIDALTRALGS
ncbi:zinc ABC transporter substrate-binding protein [Microbacterium sp. AZCO]|uniref:metal ABC transporter solute-binding protein, Zn/Mn family n=1 Tax=Microbacterium sp. AZCO TaxID=3142976 RepID=UPI0031F3B0F8